MTGIVSSKKRVQQQNSANGTGMPSSTRFGNIILICLNVILFIASLYLYLISNQKLGLASDFKNRAKSILSQQKHDSLEYSESGKTSLTNPLGVGSEINSQQVYESIPCNDNLWCKVPMPIMSHYKFDPPTDKTRWRRAQSQAASGEQVLLKRIVKWFPSPYNIFLDGDRQFRGLHSLVDVFVDSKKDFEYLLPGGLPNYQMDEPDSTRTRNRMLTDKDKSNPNSNSEEPLVKNRNDRWKYVPPPYDFRTANRAPVIQIGFIGFKRDLGAYFKGSFKGGQFMAVSS